MSNPLTKDNVRYEEDGHSDVVVCAAHFKAGLEALDLGISLTRLVTCIATSKKKHQWTPEEMIHTDVGPINNGKQVQNGEGRYQAPVDLLKVRSVAPHHLRE